MRLSLFFKHALWVAPLSLVLAWMSQAQADPIFSGKKRPANHSTRPAAGVQFGASDIPLPNLATVADCRKVLAALEADSSLHPLIASALRDRALRAWLDFDSESALVSAEKQVKVWGPGFGKDLFRVWLDLDPDSAIEALSLSSPALRQFVMLPFFSQLADLDPSRCFKLIGGAEWRGEYRDGFEHQRGLVYLRVFGNLAELDPEAAFQTYFQALDDKVFPQGDAIWALTKIFGVWAAKDPLAALKFYQSSPEKFPQGSGLMAIEPELARHVLIAHPDRIGEFTMNYEKISEGWASSDLSGALEFSSNLPAGHELRSHLLVAVAERLVLSDPERALALYQDGHESSVREKNPWGSDDIGFPPSFFDKAFQMLNSRDPERAMELVSALPKDKKALAFGGIFRNEFAKEPTAAIGRVQVLMSDPALKDSAKLGLHQALSWSGEHTGEMIEAVPEMRSIVTGDLLESWATHDPEAVAHFISEEVESKVLRPSKALSEIAAARPEFTATWLQTLPEGSLQNNATAALAANWATFDRPAAEAWAADLPDGLIKELAEQVLSK